MKTMSAVDYPRNYTRNHQSACITMRMTVFILAILVAGGAFAQSSPESQLTLSDFLTQVSLKHEGYRASDRTARGARLQAAEGSLVFEPLFSATASSSSDAQSNPFESNDKLKIRSYSAGLSQNSRFGLGAQLSYRRTELDYPVRPNPFNYQTDWVQLDLTQSLSRNWLGRETKAQSELAEAGALAKSFSQSYVTKSYLLEAESAYWRLTLAREMVTMQKESIERAQRIFDWTNRRVRLQLADRAELLQASTNLQARKLELRQSEDEERAARQAFNSSRGVLSDQVSETLVTLTPELIATFNIPERTIMRDDVRAAEQNAKASAASARLARERNKPTVELFGSVPVTAPSGSASSTTAALLPATARAATTVGIRLSAPLNLATQAKVREGHEAEAQAADLTLRRRKFEEERDWNDLTSRFTQAKDRLKLYIELEKTQREKLNYERDRQQRGRSTLQQVLFFENDFEQAQLGRIRTLAELLTLNAQMKLYGVSYESR